MSKPKKTLISVTRSVRKDYGFAPEPGEQEPGGRPRNVRVSSSRRKVKPKKKLFARPPSETKEAEDFLEALEGSRE